MRRRDHHHVTIIFPARPNHHKPSDFFDNVVAQNVRYKRNIREVLTTGNDYQVPHGFQEIL